MQLTWPYEGSTPLPGDAPRFAQAGSNICLDFHGDPRTADLVVFSDGNHHMALADALAAFYGRCAGAAQIFYVTTPPGVVVDAMKAGRLVVGHLHFSVAPHVFLGPLALLESLSAEGRVGRPEPLAASRGNVLLVRKGNPCHIASVADLARDDVRLFLSNPATEEASHRNYTATIRRVADREGVDVRFLDAAPGTLSRIVFGERIHHREAPQCLADGVVDVAVVFHHLALRYTRAFPELFHFVPFGDERDHVVARTGISLVGSGGAWGVPLTEFMLGSEVAGIYRHHGLVPAR